MRNNQPITNEEYIIPEGLTLVSKTDLLGNITEVNDAFELASGFTREELIGQPHNLVRHPDVPEAVFKDLWTTLKMGATWSQIVKNRRKNGGFYWVRANVTPLFENGQISGYLSFRTEATDAEKAAASQAYQDIKTGKCKIQYSKIYTGLNWQQLNVYPKLNPQWQLSILTLLFSALPFTYLALQDGLNPAIIVTVIALMFAPGFIFGLNLLKAQRSARKALRKVANNEPIQMTCTRPNHFEGKLIAPIISTSISIRETLEKSHSLIDKAAQQQVAIDKSSSNLMITDANFNITYMNENMRHFMKQLESTLKTLIPQFDAQNLIGQSIYNFHSNSQYQKDLIKVTEPTTTQVKLGHYHLAIHITPIFNRAGIRVSNLAEWEDKTQEVQLLEDVGHAVNNAKYGLLGNRINTAELTGIAQNLSQAINDLFDAVEAPINEAVSVGTSLAEGNLLQHIQGNYSGRFAVLKDSLNVAVDNLASMMAQTQQATQSVAEGALEIKNSSLDLSDRTQNQAASLEETASAMEEITSTVENNATNTQQASETTQQATQQTEHGVVVMENAIQAMEEIHESSQKISDIIALIDSIAFQTNLLALNAAVEAARAGDHGRGFAVVAGEVRNLAGKSADAAKDIRTLIEDTVHKVSEGTVHVKNSGEALKDITTSIQTINHIIEEITRSSHEQSLGVTMVNQAIASIDAAVQQNAAMVEETAATSEELGDMAELMMNNVSQFKINPNLIHLGTALQTGNFDFASARRGHRQWRVKVRAYINDVDIDFNKTTAADGTQCALGKWLYSHGQSYASLPSFQALEKSHTELHAFIGQIIQLKDAGDEETANHKMDELEALSNDVINRIDALEKDIAGQAPVASAPASTTRTTTRKAPVNQKPKTAKPTQRKSTNKPTTPKAPVATEEEWGEF